MVMKATRKMRQETRLGPSAVANWDIPSLLRFVVTKTSPLPVPSLVNSPLLSAFLHFSQCLLSGILVLFLLLLPGTVWKSQQRTLGLVLLLETGQELKWAQLTRRLANPFQVIPEAVRKKQRKKTTKQQRLGVTRLLFWCKESVKLDPAYLQHRNSKVNQNIRLRT